MNKSLRLAALLSVVAGLVALSARATMVLPMNFSQLAGGADRIFIGTCSSVKEGQTAEGLPFTEYTFTVLEGFKGQVGETVTFRQVGQLAPRRYNDKLAQVFRVPGMPVYRPGQKALLFLHADSRIGLTSPVGLFQGAFLLSTDLAGAEVAVNGADNANLFRGMESLPAAAQQHRQGPVKLSLLRTLLKQAE